MVRRREERALSAITTLLASVTGESALEDRLHVLVEKSAALFDMPAAALLLLDPTGQVSVAAATGHHGALLELLQLKAGEGPCLEAATTGTLVTVPDIAGSSARWPHFSHTATDSGYTSVHALPLRHGHVPLGSLNLFSETATILTDADVHTVQALANIATINIAHQRHNDAGNTTRAQLQAALDSRTIIEQAKGWLANRNSITPEAAFTLLRDYARHHRAPLTEIALGILTGRLPAPPRNNMPRN